MKILIIDNFDSFTYNLLHIVEQKANFVVVKRNNNIFFQDIEAADAIIISPGPGLPKDTGQTYKFIENFYEKKPILGICLGMQIIGEFFGSKLKNLSKVYHGKRTPITIIDKEEVFFKNIPKSVNVGRYHSWVVDKKTLSKSLKVTAIDKNGEIMAFSHKKYNIKGVQFHPESIMTSFGKKMIFNWLSTIF